MKQIKDIAWHTTLICAVVYCVFCAISGCMDKPSVPVSVEEQTKRTGANRVVVDTVAIADDQVCRTITDFPYVLDRGVSLNNALWAQGQTLRIRQRFERLKP